MGYVELKNWDAVFADVDCIRVMLYLAKYNPNKRFEEIKTKLDLSQSKLDNAMNKLIDAQMVKIEEECFTLKDSALIALDNFRNINKAQA